MQSSFFNSLDYLYILLLFISCMMGFFKGFTKDFFSTCSWLGSGFISAIIAPYLSIYIRQNQILTDPLLAKIAATSISFILSLAIIHKIINKISSNIKNSCFSGIDRALGAFYGFVRGLLLLVAICSVVSMFNIVDQKSSLLSKSKLSAPLINLVNTIVPKLTTISKFKSQPAITPADILKTREFSKRLVTPYKHFQTNQPNNQYKNEPSKFRKLFNFLQQTLSHFFNRDLFSINNNHTNQHSHSISSALLNQSKTKPISKKKKR